ncbi:hypothetical protein K402DRAFT_404382 [Aulographum hederae CBS 113979]|uniref:Uncharacterized protein n=1 Tax=Aulographum hederae CBS 113979 TaxID=1176131 RepID=A0A6G1H0H7_9PEZI|nr:hypothetical protein K402DRAFT_404382 [Aulographum hederae CBS 113979]
MWIVDGFGGRQQQHRVGRSADAYIPYLYIQDHACEGQYRYTIAGRAENNLEMELRRREAEGDTDTDTQLSSVGQVHPTQWDDCETAEASTGLLCDTNPPGSCLTASVCPAVSTIGPSVHLSPPSLPSCEHVLRGEYLFLVSSVSSVACPVPVISSPPGSIPIPIPIPRSHATPRSCSEARPGAHQPRRQPGCQQLTSSLAGLPDVLQEEEHLAQESSVRSQN